MIAVPSCLRIWPISQDWSQGSSSRAPIPHAHVVTLTTYKNLRGVRGGLILSRNWFGKKTQQRCFSGGSGIGDPECGCRQGSLSGWSPDRIPFICSSRSWPMRGPPGKNSGWKQDWRRHWKHRHPSDFGGFAESSSWPENRPRMPWKLQDWSATRIPFPEETQPPQITSGLRFGVSGNHPGFQEKTSPWLENGFQRSSKLFLMGKKWKWFLPQSMEKVRNWLESSRFMKTIPDTIPRVLFFEQPREHEQNIRFHHCWRWFGRLCFGKPAQRESWKPVLLLEAEDRIRSGIFSFICPPDCQFLPSNRFYDWI